MTTENTHNDLAALQLEWTHMMSAIHVMSAVVILSGTDDQKDRAEQAVQKTKAKYNTALAAMKLLKNAVRNDSSPETIAELWRDVRRADDDIRVCFVTNRLTIQTIAALCERRR